MLFTCSLFTATTYPLPSSYPSIFSPSSLTTSKRGILAATPSTPRPLPTSISLLSSFTLSPSGLPALFSNYATFLDKCVKRKVDWEAVGAGDAIDGDEVKELRDEMWVLADGFGVREGGEESELGEDEERGKQWEEDMIDED